MRCALATSKGVSCNDARCELVGVAMVSFFPNPPRVMCPSAGLVPFSVALVGEAGDDFSLIWRVAVEWEALGVLVFSPW